MQFILGSASPRRLELLQKVGFTPDEVISADIDETPNKKELPKNFVARIAKEKAEAILGKIKTEEFTLLTGDTIVSMGRSIIGKASDAKEAKQQLQKMSGRSHGVFSGICIVKKQNGELKYSQKIVYTKVRFKTLAEQEIDEYLATNEWQGRAGSCSINGIGGAFIKSINGSPSNVAGLPLYEVRNMLLGMGLKQSFSK